MNIHQLKYLKERGIVIPDDFTEFLYWFKETTEAYWSSKYSTYGESFSNAKWIGMKDWEIEMVEEKYKVKFTPDHKMFLRILHTLDRRVSGHHEEDEERSFFYNWLVDEKEIKNMLHWPYREVFSDVLDSFWLDSWGIRPETDEEKEVIFAAWYEKASKLIPLYAHRFMVSEPMKEGNPVLSVWGSDTILYGRNMRDYLLNELGDIIFHGLNYNEIEGDVDLKLNAGKEFIRISTEVTKSISGWGELMIHAGHSWYNRYEN